MYTALIWQVAGTAVGIFSASLLPLLATCRPENGMRWVVVLQKLAYISELMARHIRLQYASRTQLSLTHGVQVVTCGQRTWFGMWFGATK